MPLGACGLHSASRQNRNSRVNPRRPWTCCALALGLAGAIAAAAPAQPTSRPCRYDLRPGQRLVYERRARVLAADGVTVASRSRDQFQLRCLEVRERTALVLVDWIRASGPPLIDPRGTLLRLSDRQVVEFLPEYRNRIGEVEPLLDILPSFPLLIEDGPQWTAPPDMLGQRCTYHQHGPDPEHGGARRIEFSLDAPPAFGLSDARSQRGTFWFDAQRGVVVRVEGERPVTAAGTVEQFVWTLYQSDSLPPDWCRDRLREVEPFAIGLRAEDTLFDRLYSNPVGGAAAISRLGRIWPERLFARALQEASPFYALALARQRILAAEEPRLRARARLAEQWLDSRAADWSLQDAEGRTIRSEELVGAPLLEFFWSTQSAWSTRMLPVVRRVQEELSTSPLNIVCINTDSDLSLAKETARSAGAGLRHVFSGPPIGDADPELPVVRLLDEGRRVRKLWLGWRSDLADWVRAALPAKP